MEDEDKDRPGPSREDVKEDVVEIPLIPEKKRRKNLMGDGMSKSKSFAGMRGPNTGGTSSSWASSTVMNMMKVGFLC
jgi:hypothetical protein